jgi:hypothetical protein
VGASRDTTITAQYRNITLRSALRAILGPLDMRYVMRDGVLILTSAEKAANDLTTVVYPVRGLVALMDRSGTADELNVRHELAETILRTIAPPTWDGNQSGIHIRPSVMPGALVCMQTDDVHHQIDDFLSRLRQTYAAQKKRDEPATKAADSELTIVTYSLVGPDGNPPPDGFAREVESAVRKLVAPDSWQNEKSGAWLGTVSNRLIVRQRPAIQREVADVLKKIGAIDGAQPQGSAQGGGGAAF